jgi:hypothetical protein
MTPRAVVTLAAVALWAGVFVSEATAVGPCNKKVCSEEIAAGCAGLKGMALSVCTKAVLLNCDTTDCSCTDPTLPACTPTTTSSTTTTSTSTTTTTTTPPTQCCVQSSPMGAFDICVLVETAAQCTAQGGIDHGSGTCSPNPCLPSCIQPGDNCVSCGTCGNGLCAWNGSNTCGTHHSPNPVCINLSECSGGPCSAATGDASCPPGQACVLVGGALPPICCAGCF